MKQISKEDLYELFRNYDKPDECDFKLLIDECYNEMETTPIGEDITVQSDCGGISKGTKYNKLTPLIEVIKDMLGVPTTHYCILEGCETYHKGSVQDVYIHFGIDPDTYDEYEKFINKVELYKDDELVCTMLEANRFTWHEPELSENTKWTVKIYNTFESDVRVDELTGYSRFCDKLYYGTSKTIPTEVPATGWMWLTSDKIDLTDKFTWDKECYYVMLPSSFATADVVTQNSETITSKVKNLIGANGADEPQTYKVLYNRTDVPMMVKFNKFIVTR